jgi:two-component system, NtrC family, nitrogen regulation sensor histidine kinase GlnL
MTTVYNFSVNKKMLISSWDEGMEELAGYSASVAIGQKYYNVFPRLLRSDKDAVAFAMEKNRKLVLKRYVFQCLFCRVKADVIIKPVSAAKKNIGARIEVSHVSTSDGYKPEDIQRLIAVGKKATTLAHGVRNPLNCLKGAVTHISQKYFQEQVVVEFTKIMAEEISKLDIYISGFLNTSNLDMQSSRVDINALLKKIEILISFQANERNIHSDFIYGTIPQAVINPFQIEQAILNVINNALEAVDTEGKLTVITSSDRTSERDFIVVEVVDNGPGMPKNRFSDITIRRKKGKGFGLLITKGIMDYYGGRLNMQSVKGRGTVVKLYIPAHTIGGANE